MTNLSSIFHLLIYDYKYFTPKRCHYPTIPLRRSFVAYYDTLEEAEEEIKRDAASHHGDETGTRRYAYVVIEIPKSKLFIPGCIERHVSQYIYRPDGTCWMTRNYQRKNVADEESDGNHVEDSRNVCLIITSGDIRFKPGDIVEVFGCPCNTFWSDAEVTLTIVVKCPEVGTSPQSITDDSLHHRVMHADNPLRTKVPEVYPYDCYEVISQVATGIDWSSVIATFPPSLPVSRHNEKRLRKLYEEYQNKES